MRVYLLTPASTNVLASRRYATLEPALMPMALAYLGGALRAAGHEVQLRDQAATTLPNERVVDEVGAARPDLIGVSVLTGAWRNTVELIRALRRRVPGTPTVMGNTHATVFVDEVLGEGYADHVIRGEGEEAIVELANALERGTPLGAIAGLSWIDGDGIHHNPDRGPIEDLDALPLPAWDLLDLRAWRYQRIPLVNLRTHPVPIMASRGCPYRCSFCSQDKVVKRFRRRRIEAVVDEIDTMITRFGFRAYGFNDSYFPWTRESGLEFVDRLRARPWHRDTRWVTETRVDRVDDELMGAMASVGLHAIFYGFESGNEGVLQGLGKGTTLEQGREAVRIAHRHGVRVVGFFMLGMPGETRQTIEDTIRYAMDIGVDIAKFAITIPYPGSPLFDQLGRRQLELEECDQFTSWFDWSGREGRLLWAPEGLAPEQLQYLQRWAMLRFYARPSYVWKALRQGLFSPSEVALGGHLLLSRFLASSRP